MTDMDKIERLGAHRETLRHELVKITAQLAQLSVDAVAAGHTEAGVARAARVDRMTMRKWLGKRS